MSVLVPGTQTRAATQARFTITKPWAVGEALMKPIRFGKKA